MTETESNTNYIQEQQRTNEGNEMWNEWPLIYEQNLITAVHREKALRDQLINKLLMDSEQNQKIKEMLRARNPFRLLPDPSQPYAPFPTEITEKTELIPIRIDVEIDGTKVDDTLCINRYNVAVEANIIAYSLVHDFNLPQIFLKPIHQSIIDQASDHDSTLSMEEKWREEYGYVFGKLRVPIKLDITVGMLHVKDMFEWALEGMTGMSPEEVAEKYCIEFALPLEFRTAVAHAIREQVMAFKKALLLSGTLSNLRDKPANEARRLLTAVDPDLASVLIFPDSSKLLRENTRHAPLSEWSPAITELMTKDDKNALEQKRDREIRRNKRHASLPVQETGKKRRGRKPKHVQAEVTLKSRHVTTQQWSILQPPCTLRTPVDFKYKAPPQRSPSPPPIGARRKYNKRG